MHAGESRQGTGRIYNHAKTVRSAIDGRPVMTARIMAGTDSCRLGRLPFALPAPDGDGSKSGRILRRNHSPERPTCSRAGETGFGFYRLFVRSTMASLPGEGDAAPHCGKTFAPDVRIAAPALSSPVSKQHTLGARPGTERT